MPRVRRTDAAAVRLPPDLVGPVEVELTPRGRGDPRPERAARRQPVRTEVRRFFTELVNFD
jgi:hypothetical protein